MPSPDRADRPPIAAEIESCRVIAIGRRLDPASIVQVA